VKHIARADELAGLSLGLNQIDDPEPPLRFPRHALSDRVGESPTRPFDGNDVQRSQ
jgi:hypothetical protein